MTTYTLNFYGLKRELPLTYIGRNKRIANVNILGDIEFTEKAGEILEKKLRKQKIIPDTFVGPEEIISYVYNLGLRFHHKRFVVLRSKVKRYMVDPIVENPPLGSPEHVRSLVLNNID